MSNMVRMKANDTLHVSSVGPHNLAPGEEFEVSSVFADDLESRGLAKRVGGKSAAKADAAPANKAEPAPLNKATAPVSAKRGRSARR